MNLPGYDFIPAPLWVVTSLHLLTLTLHFAAMNVLAGGAVILLARRRRGGGTDAVSQRLGRALPITMAAAVTLGVAPLLFVQLVYPKQIYAASVASAWPWMGILLAAIAAYYLLYASVLSEPGSRRVAVYLGGAIAAFLYVSLVYSATFSLAERPLAQVALYAQVQSGAALNPDAGAYLLRWGHMLAGAVAVAGLFLGLLAKDDLVARASARRWFAWGAGVSAVLGLAYLFSLGEAFGPFMRSAGIWAVTVGTALTGASLWAFFRGRASVAAALLLLSLGAMVGARHALRLVRLEAAGFDPAATPVSPQWSVFAVFLLSFVLALVLIAWMIRALVAARRSAAG